MVLQHVKSLRYHTGNIQRNHN